MLSRRHRTNFLSLFVFPLDSSFLSHQLNLFRMKEHASDVQNIVCMKSKIEGQRIHQLSSLAGDFHPLQCRISCKIHSNPVMHAILSSIGFVLGFGIIFKVLPAHDVSIVNLKFPILNYICFMIQEIENGD